MGGVSMLTYFHVVLHLFDIEHQLCVLYVYEECCACTVAVIKHVLPIFEVVLFLDIMEMMDTGPVFCTGLHWTQLHFLNTKIFSHYKSSPVSSSPNHKSSIHQFQNAFFCKDTIVCHNIYLLSLLV